MMVDFETIIALASLTYIVDLDVYESHMGDENIFKDFINICYDFTLYTQ